MYKIRDGGGASGVVTGQREAVVNLRIALRLRALLQAAGGIRVKMTRTTTCCVSHGNVWRAQYAIGSDAALFLRIHADGSTNHAIAGTSTLYPANHPGWTSALYARRLQAARIIQARLVAKLVWPNRGIVPRSDITGFNWSNPPVVLHRGQHFSTHSRLGSRPRRPSTSPDPRGRSGCATACSPTCTRA